MVSLPGDSASSERVVSTPYATASNAQTTATITPWSDRKLDKGTPLDSDKAETTARTGRRGARGVYRATYCPGTHKRPDDCAGPALRTRLLVGLVAAPAGCAAGELHERHLQPRQRVLDAAPSAAVIAAPAAGSGPARLDRLLGLREVALAAPAPGGAARPALRAPRLISVNDRLQQHVVDA